MSRTRTRRTSVRQLVRIRADGKCELCGIEVNVHGDQADLDFPTMHHRWPRRESGIDMVQNLLYLCRGCHKDRVHEDEYVARCLGWMAAKDALLDTPVLMYFGWALLDEDGSFCTLPWWVAEELNRGHDINYLDASGL